MHFNCFDDDKKTAKNSKPSNGVYFSEITRLLTIHLKRFSFDDCTFKNVNFPNEKDSCAWNWYQINGWKLKVYGGIVGPRHWSLNSWWRFHITSSCKISNYITNHSNMFPHLFPTMNLLKKWKLNIVLTQTFRQRLGLCYSDMT